MEDQQLKIMEFFEQNLKAEDYLNTMNLVWRKESELFLFMMTYVRDVFRSGRFQGSKLLDIGSGATVHNVASASAYFPNITLSDYVTDNVQNLKLWVEGKSNLPQLLDIPARLEFSDDDLETGKTLLESRIRKSIKRIARCDLLTDQVLLDGSSDQDTSPPFDVVTTCLTLEVAPKDYEGYCEILKRVNRLLKKGGGLLAVGFLQGSYWTVGGRAFHHVKVSQKDVLDALAKAGFGRIDIKTKDGAPMEDGDFTYDKLYCLAAEKL